jgi:hypothetical protein
MVKVRIASRTPGRPTMKKITCQGRVAPIKGTCQVAWLAAKLTTKPPRKKANPDPI